MICLSHREWRRWFPVVLAGGMLCRGVLLAEDAQATKPAEPTQAVVAEKVANDTQALVEAEITDLSQILLQSAALKAASSGPTRPEENLSEFWIGIAGNAAENTLRAHLAIPDDRGLLVTQVVDEGPAARAGLKLHDILMSVGEKPLKDVSDLAEVIGEKKDALVQLRLIREGKPIIVEVKPERRPLSQTGETCPAISKAGDEAFYIKVYTDLLETTPDADKIKTFIADQQKDKRVTLANKLLRRSTAANRSCTACHATDADDVKLSRQLVDAWKGSLYTRLNINQLSDGHVANVLRLTQPTGVLLSGTAVDFVDVGDLPDDVTITLTRRGKEPVAIRVANKSGWWGATEKDYQQTLPAEYRAHVERMLNGARAAQASQLDAIRLWMTQPNSTAESATKPEETKPAAADDSVKHIQQEIDRMVEKLNELQKSVGELKRKSGK